MRTLALALVVVLVLACSPASAKHHFRRVYRRSRRVVIRHQGRVKQVPTNCHYARYDERNYPTGSSGNGRTAEASATSGT